MPRACTVCTNPNRDKIDKLLIAGSSIRAIASQFSINRNSLQRHSKAHIPKRLAKSKEVRDSLSAKTLIEQVEGLRSEALSILKRAKEDNDLRTAVFAINSVKGVLELLGKLIGELKDSPQINLTLSSEWVQIRTVIMKSLEPYPKARNTVSEALGRYSNGFTSY